MKRSQVALGLLLALLGAVAAWLLSFGGGEVPVANSVPTMSVPRRTAEILPLQSGQRQSVSPLPGWLAEMLRGNDGGEEGEGDGQRHRCRLKGKVIVKGKPWLTVPGLRVRLTRMWLDTVMPSQLSLPEKFFLQTETVTDKNGRFVLENVPLRHLLFLVLQRDRTIYEVHKVEEIPNPGKTRDLGEVVFVPRGSVHARVVDGAGNPVAGVEVRAVDDKYNKGVTLDQTLAEQRILRAAGFDPRRRSRGRMYGASVRRRDRFLPFPRVETDTDGSFTLHGVREGEVTLFLNASDGHGVENQVLVAAHETTELGDLILARGRQLRLRLVDRPNNQRNARNLENVEPRHLEPIAGARVSVQPDSWAVAVPQVVTDQDGYCTVRVPKGSSYRVHVRCPGRRVWEQAYSLDLRWGAHCYAVRSATTCRVRLTDRSGVLVPDANVVLYAYGQRHGAMARIGKLSAEQRSPGGSFEFPGIPAAAEVLVVGTAPGFAVAVERGFARATFELTMQHGVRVRIVTVDRAGQPVAGAGVTAKFLESRLPRHRRLAGDSWYLLTELRPAVLGRTNDLGILDVVGLGRGRAQFAATHLTFTQSPTPDFQIVSDAQVTIRLFKRARLEGNLLLDHLPPMRPLQIRARPRDGITTQDPSNPWLGSHRTITGEGGTFYFNDLYPGPWILSVEAPGGPSSSGSVAVWPEGERQEVHVEAGRRVLHTMKLKRKDYGFGIRGRVRLQGRPTRGDLFVVARPSKLPDRLRLMRRKPESWSSERWGKHVDRLMARSRSQPRYRDMMKKLADTKPSRVLARCRVSMSDGRYSLPLQRGGAYDVGLHIMQAGRRQALATRRVEIGVKSAPKIKILDLTLATGDLELIVSKDYGVRVGRRILSLHQADVEPGAVFRLRTDADGVARLAGIPAGRYEVRSKRTRDGVGEFLSTPSFVVDPGTLSRWFLTTSW